MSIRWRKLGLLYKPDPGGRSQKLLTHAANPLPVHREGHIYRVFYSGRDSQNRSSVGAVDIDIVRCEVLNELPEPAFAHGPEGSFYADGVSCGNCYLVGGVRYMLFMGWQSPPDRHWRGDIGRLVVGADLSLRLDGDAPFLSCDDVDPISLSYPWVMDCGDGFRMWYGSTLSWDAGNGEMLHVINQAKSADGANWERLGAALPRQLGIAQAFSRPTVVGNEASGYQMWFSYRGGKGTRYRIGYATSADGGRWVLRLADAGIGVSDLRWDSDMIEYPFVFDHKGEWLMLYCGNSYGRTGFGIRCRRMITSRKSFRHLPSTSCRESPLASCHDERQDVAAFRFVFRTSIGDSLKPNHEPKLILLLHAG